MSGESLDLPIGKRTMMYRFFEMLPALLSYGAFIILIFLSIVWPSGAALYLLLVILAMFVKSVGIAYRILYGHHKLMQAQKVDWHQRLDDIVKTLEGASCMVGRGFESALHQNNLEAIASGGLKVIDPRSIRHAVIIATYNESYEVLKPTVESVKRSMCDNASVILCIAYEERGGESTEKTVKRLRNEYEGVFGEFLLIKHPKDIPNEIQGKGANITYAGYELKRWCDDAGVKYDQVIVTTLDSDNRPHPTYFDYVAYVYSTSPDRERLSYQPIALYFGNIWDAPAPMRVLATGNSFWTIISSMRPHTLRNFAAHSQPLTALVKMNFWSKLSIVEDGHQYWRSYFYYRGDYGVVPIHVPIYQDAVLSDTLRDTMISQFKQLQRWGYGASDVPYVAVRLFSRKRTVPFWGTFARFIRLIDGHVSLATMAVLVAFGAWVPLLINPGSARDISSHSLPIVVSNIQQVAMIGVFITILLMLKMLPPRPERYRRSRTVFMVLQWILMPFTSICYSAAASLSAQTRLLLGRYLEKFDVTEKATLSSRAKAKAQARAAKSRK